MWEKARSVQVVIGTTEPNAGLTNLYKGNRKTEVFKGGKKKRKSAISFSASLIFIWRAVEESLSEHDKYMLLKNNKLLTASRWQ